MKKLQMMQDILKIIDENNKFILIAHRHPDGDTIGSQLALLLFLEKKKKTVKVVSVDPVPRKYHFLPDWKRIEITPKVEEDFDVAIVLECSDLYRAGDIIDLSRRVKLTINIDHHATSEYFGELNMIDPTASSTSEQVYYLLRQSRENISPEQSLYLYVGVLTDTGKFQEANTTARAHSVASELISNGMLLSPVEIANEIFENNTVPAMMLLSKSLATLRLHLGDKVSSMDITRNMYEETGTKEEDTEGFINYARSICGIKIAVLFKEVADGVKVSFRSREDIDVNKLAMQFGGGGHKRAAGCFIKTDMQSAKKNIIEEIEKILC